MPRLIILRGDNVERELDLGSQDVRIGRGAENDLVLDDPTKAVSRFHAEVRSEGKDWVLIDLNSQNGTWIDGRRIQKTTLSPGVTVSLGPYHVKYQEGAGAAAAPAVLQASMPPPTDTLVGGKIRPMNQALPTKAVPPPRAPAKSVSKSKAAPAANDNIVSRLARVPKPILFGGFGAFMVITIIVGQMVKPSDSAPASDQKPGAAEQTPAPSMPELSNAEIIAKHLTDGKAMLDKGEAEAAIRDHFEQVLLIEPNHPEATELKLKAQESIRQASATPAAQSAPPATPAPATPNVTPASPPVASAPPKPAAPPAVAAGQFAKQVDNFGIARNAGESQADWRARSSRIHDRYNDAKAALQKNEFEAAISGFEALDRDQPDYQDVRSLLTNARAGLRGSAQDAVAAAAKLEKSGDLLGALGQLSRARQLDASVGIDDSVRRIREQILKDADDAYSRARVYDARGRLPEAIALYERVVQLLPPDHANRRAAQDRLSALRARSQ